MDLIGRDVRFQREPEETGEAYPLSSPFRVEGTNAHGLFARDERGLWFIPWENVGHMRVDEGAVDLSRLPRL